MLVILQNMHFWHHNACNHQNMPFWHHNATVGPTWLTKIWLVKSHRHNRTCQNIQLPVSMLTAVVRKCGQRWRKLKHFAGDDEMIKTACSFGMNNCDFFWTFVGADSCNAGSLTYSYLNSRNTCCLSWNVSSLYGVLTVSDYNCLLLATATVPHVWAVGWIQQMSQQEVATDSWEYHCEMNNLFMQTENTFLWLHFYRSGSSICLKILLTTPSYLLQSYCRG